MPCMTAYPITSKDRLFAGLCTEVGNGSITDSWLGKIYPILLAHILRGLIESNRSSLGLAIDTVCPTSGCDTQVGGSIMPNSLTISNYNAYYMLYAMVLVF